MENGVNGVGSALKGLDTALEQIAAQQRKEETQFVAKVIIEKYFSISSCLLNLFLQVSSRQTSKRGSVSVSAEDANDVTNVMVSLPASRSTSRTTSRRNSIDLGNKGRRSRRGSLDIYTAEYALKLGNQKNITNMQQKNSFHMKVDDKNENNLNLCGRCHLPNCKYDLSLNDWCIYNYSTYNYTISELKPVQNMETIVVPDAWPGTTGRTRVGHRTVQCTCVPRVITRGTQRKFILQRNSLRDVHVWIP